MIGVGIEEEDLKHSWMEDADAVSNSQGGGGRVMLGG